MARAFAPQRGGRGGAWGIALGVAVLLAVCGVVAVTVWFGAYLRGDSFRELVARATGGALRVRAEIAPLRWSGPSAFSELLRLEGGETSVLKELTASQVRADVNWRAMVSGAWRVEEITVTEANAQWQRPSGEVAEGREAGRDLAPPILAELLPRRFELGRLSVGSANMRFEGIGIEGTALEVTPDGAGWVLSGRGGHFQQPGIPRLDLTNFRARIQGGELFLTEGKLRLGAGGKISVSGELTQTGKLLVAWEGVSSAEVFPSGLAKHLTGVLSGSAQIASPGTVEGDVRMQEGWLQGVPLLATIGDFTQNPSFRRMPLQDVQCHFSREEGGWRITGFVAESKGLLRVEGEGRIGDDGTLEADLRVGVTPQTLQWIPGSRDKVFTEARDGYLWAGVIVGGSVAHPNEDLSARLLSAMGGAVIEQGGELLRQTPEKAAQGVKSVLDILRPLVP